MASSVYDDDSFDSNLSQDYVRGSFDSLESHECPKESSAKQDQPRNVNVIHKLNLRQVYGRVTRNPRAKTENLLSYVHCQCKYQLGQLIGYQDALNHFFMGFTLCGRYFISYTEKYVEDGLRVLPTIEYELYIWRFIPGKKLRYIAKYRIFRLLQGHYILREVMFMQFPTDPYRLICYGSYTSETVMAFLTILTLPTPNNCKYCKLNSKFEQGWCLRHGFMIHYSFSLTQSFSQGSPAFNPHLSLAYPDHFVINTGVNIHILNVQSSEPTQPDAIPPALEKYDEKNPIQTVNCSFTDNASEVSEISIDNFSTNSTIEAILEDFSEYDLESSECNRPFHELNISCEPLNVTGKSYHNTLIQNNIVDPRVKRLQMQSANNKDCFSIPQNSAIQKADKPKIIDKKIAEKAYEFIEENEKCEKLSSFRKKRLADKKYEFSEDNSENIVPFNSLRRERRFFRSSDLNNTLFLSPRSPGLRSPMLSPNSRNGQFKSSPHHSKSPISPRECARKFHVYSPSMDSDCSDCDSRLILKQPTINSEARFHQNTSGLLIVDGNRKDESSKWIKKVVRRYSSVDYFENSSLVSGQSKDDYNMPIEIPLIVQNLADLQFDVVPDFKDDQVTETQLIITQRTFDCEQFVQSRAQKLCSDRHLQFLYCEDYDVKLLHICPINGHIVCQAVIKISALQTNVAYSKPEAFIANCVFTWNVATDAFELIEPPDQYKMQRYTENMLILPIDIPPNNCREVLVMDFIGDVTKKSLRDYSNCYEIFMETNLLSPYYDF